MPGSGQVRRSRRERPHDSSEIEFIAPAARHGLGDPADRVTFDDGVRLALLVVLQRLSPAERVVFVLHDVFQMPFDTVAETVGRAVPSCRQLARRARQKIAAAHGGVRFDAVSAEHRRVTEKFIAACANGELSGLLEVLAPDAWGDVDLGPDAGRSPAVTIGAEHVARASSGSTRREIAFQCRAVRRGTPVARLRRKPAGPMAAIAAASPSSSSRLRSQPCSARPERQARPGPIPPCANPQAK